MRAFRVAVVAALATCLVLTAPSTASASRTPDYVPPAASPRVISDQVLAPFNLSLWGRRVTVADGTANLVATVDTGTGTLGPIATDQPGASGVADSWDGRTLAWTTTVSNPQTFENTASGLSIRSSRGTIYADTFAYESANNPDAINTYGIADPTQCQIDAFAAIGFPVRYPGLVDSHAYSVAAYLDRWVVADAGSNTLWSIDRTGAIRTLAVLPPQPATITAEAAAALGLGDYPCVVGAVYAFEPVPTDVEVGRDGSLYVTTLPGGPEGPELGARGSVYRVNPYRGTSSQVSTGFLGATNLAIGWRGEIYVAELFGDRISMITNDRTSQVVSLPGAVAVEFGIDGSLWAGTMGDPEAQIPGTIVKVSDGRAYWQAFVRR